jgi:hypothetical protein
MNEVIAIGMTAHNNECSLKRAIDSFLYQKRYIRTMHLIISLDASDDGSEKIIRGYLHNRCITLLKVNYNSAVENRNHINNYVRSELKNCILIGRLDADDELNGSTILAQVEQIYENHLPDAIIMSNYQRKNGEISPWINRPDVSLLQKNNLLERLRRMSEGELKSELPSCNTFFRPTLPIDYKLVESAEDHWLLTDILLQSDRIKIHIAEELIYCIYSLDGMLTKNNNSTGKYLKSRIDLYNYAKGKIENGDSN